MRLRNLFLVLIALLAPLPSFAQEPKQKLNDQLWEAARRGDATAVTALDRPRRIKKQGRESRAGELSTIT